MGQEKTGFELVENMRNARERKDAVTSIIASYDETVLKAKRDDLVGYIEDFAGAIQETGNSSRVGIPIGDSSLSVLMLLEPGTFSFKDRQDIYYGNHYYSWRLNIRVLVGGAAGVGVTTVCLGDTTAKDAAGAWEAVQRDFNEEGGKLFPKYRRMGKFRSWFLQKSMRTLEEEGMDIGELERIKSYLVDAVERATANDRQAVVEAVAAAEQKGLRSLIS